ncbi:recombinase family protein [Eubacterium sp. 1001713B170207_170306_E7]|uniref:recombinase family protein n=1 Tax=Eubacterium sp. 1001713B170207_170306_E7 TaxID=2787097 RepID=UPI001896A7ED
MKTYGYVRVSSKDQNEDRQLLAMEQAGVDIKNIYIDKQSGADFNRPRYKALLKKLKRDDVVIVKSIDRLGRNYKEILEQWQILTKQKGIGVVVLDMPLLNTRADKDLIGTLIADIVLQLLSYVAETERQYIRQRQAEGIAAARKKGKHLGRKPKPISSRFNDVCKEWQAGKISRNKAAKMLDISAETFKKWVEVTGNESEDAIGKRGKKKKPKAFVKIFNQWKNGGLTTQKAAAALNVSSPTFLKWAQEASGKNDLKQRSENIKRANYDTSLVKKERI